MSAAVTAQLRRHLDVLSMAAAEYLNITALAKQSPAERVAYDFLQRAIDDARLLLAQEVCS